MIMYHPIKFGCKKISSSADMVETVIFDKMGPQCDPELEDIQLVSQLVGALSPVNHRGLHWGWTHDDASSY